MKKIYQIFLSLGLMFALGSSVFALGAPTNLKLESSTDSSLQISWDAVTNAQGYTIYYGTASGSYDGSSTRLIEDTSYTIADLAKDTKYYITAVSLDEELAEGEKAEQIEATTSVADTTVPFALTNVTAVTSDILKLTFNAELNQGDDALMEFKVTKKSDKLTELDIIDASIDPDDAKSVSIIFTTASTPEVGVEYEVNAFVQDKDGRSIENGVDGTDTFIGIADLSAAAPEVTPKPAETPAPVEVIVDSEPKVESSNAGVEIDAEDVAKSTTSVAETNETLPNTGPEHIFLFVLSFILGMLVFMSRTKKSNS